MPTYRCIIKRLNPAVRTPPDFADLSWLSKVYSDASGAVITLDVIDETAQTIMATPSATTSDLELNMAAKRMVGASLPGVAVDTIGVIIADTYLHGHRALGVMFDVDERPRQACAIFAGELARSGRDAKYTTIHELGHVFNLQHQCEPKTYMRPSPDDGPAPMGWRQFDDAQKKWLADCVGNSLVQPGGKAFIGKDIVCGAAGVLAAKFDLSISTPVRAFSRIDPIELDLQISLAPGAAKRAELPDHVDPGCPGFRIWITTPSGERRRFRPKRIYQSSPGSILISAAKPFARDISLWQSSGGLTFFEHGVHELQAEFDTPQGLLRSNPLAVEILPDRAAGGVKERQRLLDPSLQSVLYYRDAAIAPETLHDIE
jgi:hypothetical protein